MKKAARVAAFCICSAASFLAALQNWKGRRAQIVLGTVASRLLVSHDMYVIFSDVLLLNHFVASFGYEFEDVPHGSGICGNQFQYLPGTQL